ncbi:MAG TPA: hypothetical protein VL860_10865 [Planctomycetota bacterium]|nr:hypothetical protein [Planctomycetota bacterium]
MNSVADLLAPRVVAATLVTFIAVVTPPPVLAAVLSSILTTILASIFATVVAARFDGSACAAVTTWTAAVFAGRSVMANPRMALGANAATTGMPAALTGLHGSGKDSEPQRDDQKTQTLRDVHRFLSWRPAQPCWRCISGEQTSCQNPWFPCGDYLLLYQ